MISFYVPVHISEAKVFILMVKITLEMRIKEELYCYLYNHDLCRNLSAEDFFESSKQCLVFFLGANGDAQTAGASILFTAEANDNVSRLGKDFVYLLGALVTRLALLVENLYHDKVGVVGAQNTADAWNREILKLFNEHGTLLNQSVLVFLHLCDASFRQRIECNLSTRCTNVVRCLGVIENLDDSGVRDSNAQSIYFG